jgi:hypothetical protein
MGLRQGRQRDVAAGQRDGADHSTVTDLAKFLG